MRSTIHYWKKKTDSRFSWPAGDTINPKTAVLRDAKGKQLSWEEVYSDGQEAYTFLDAEDKPIQFATAEIVLRDYSNRDVQIILESDVLDEKGALRLQPSDRLIRDQILN